MKKLKRLRTKRLICLVLAVLMALAAVTAGIAAATAAFADEAEGGGTGDPEVSPSPSPVTDATDAPEVMPSPTPVANPTDAPEVSPSPDATSEPGDPEASPSPTPVPDSSDAPDEPGVSPSPTPVPDATDEPGEPEVSPSPTPVPDTSDAPDEPEVSPSPTPVPDATDVPEVTPAPETTAAPTPEPSLEPTVEPTLEPTPEPTPEPAALEIRVESPEAQPDEALVYHFTDLGEGIITFRWTQSDPWDAYDVLVTGPDGAEVFKARQAEASLALPVKELAAGRYTLAVKALSGDIEAASAQLAFELPDPSQVPGENPGGAGFPGGLPGGFSGRIPSGFSFGSLAGSAMAGLAGEAEQGFRVTPGKALTSDHASGSRSMRLYGTVTPVSLEEPAAELAYDGYALEIALDGGQGLFTAAVEDGALTLTPAESGSAWTVNGFALKTLSRSGIDALRLVLDGAAVELPTDPGLQGPAYAALCAKGLVSGDYEYTVTAGDIRVAVDGADYRLGEDGALVPAD